MQPAYMGWALPPYKSISETLPNVGFLRIKKNFRVTDTLAAPTIREFAPGRATK
jgi:hypothetical protein